MFGVFPAADRDDAAAPWRHSPMVSVVWLAATRRTGREESERWEEVEGEDRAVPFTLESV